MLTFGSRVGGFRKEKRAGLSNGEFNVEKKIVAKIALRSTNVCRKSLIQKNNKALARHTRGLHSTR